VRGRGCRSGPFIGPANALAHVAAKLPAALANHQAADAVVADSSGPAYARPRSNFIVSPKVGRL